MTRLWILTLSGMLFGCEAVGWLGDWCDGGVCTLATGGGTSATGGGTSATGGGTATTGGGTATTGGGSGGGTPPTREQVCSQALFGCDWGEPKQDVFLKPTPGQTAQFGAALALSRNGSVLVVGAPKEQQSGRGVDPPINSSHPPETGAVLIFRRIGSAWAQDVYLKASNAQSWTNFGTSVAVSADGQTVAVGAPLENSAAMGVDGDSTDTSLQDSGAVYVFQRETSGWVQRAYVKASNTGGGDRFGTTVALSADGLWLAVGAPDEDGGARVINGNAQDETRPGAGAVYLYSRTAGGPWTFAAYVKAANANEGDGFGTSVSLDEAGASLLVGAPGEGGSARGVNGVGTNDPGSDRGAAYAFTRAGATWSQSASLKPRDGSGLAFGTAVSISGDGLTAAIGAPDDDDGVPPIGTGEVALFTRAGASWTVGPVITAAIRSQYDHAGTSVALSTHGNVLIVGVPGESSASTGANQDATNRAASQSGAATVWVRNPGGWTQMAYLKASNTRAGAEFGRAVAIAGDAVTVVVGSALESTQSSGVNGAQSPGSVAEVGAAYVWIPR